METQVSAGHSSVVRMTLRVAGRELPVAQMGPDFLILKESATMPAGNGVVTLTVDGVSEEIPVMLPGGIVPSSLRVGIAEVESEVLAVA